MSENDDIMPPPEGGNPFPAIRESVVGAGLVQTTDASDLHRFLKVGRDFATWIKARLDKYGFVENVDFVMDEVSPRSGENLGGRPKKVYHLTLDTAKEIAMVENNEQGRAARRYFIECERRAQGVPALDGRRVGGITKSVVVKAITDMVPEIVRAAVAATLDDRRAAPTLDFAETVSAYQMIEMAGIPTEDRQRGTAQMVTNRMIAFCSRRQVASLRTPAHVNPAEPYRFPYALACEWLLGPSGGALLIRNQIERMKAKKGTAARGSRQMHMQLVTSEGRPVA